MTNVPGRLPAGAARSAPAPSAGTFPRRPPRQILTARVTTFRRAEEPACRPTSHPVSTSRKSPRARARWKEPAPRSPPSSAWPRRGRSTRRRWSATGPSSPAPSAASCAGSYLAQSVYGYFMNGGGNCYVVRIGQNGAGGPGSARRPGQGAGRQPDRADRPAEGRRPRPGRRARATSASRSPTRAATARPRTCSGWWSSVSGEVVEEFDRASFGRGKQNVVTMVNAASKTVQLEDTGSGAVERLADGETALVAPAAAGRRCRRPGSAPTTTSATSPTGPASPGWRRSRRSPCSACRT